MDAIQTHWALIDQLEGKEGDKSPGGLGNHPYISADLGC